MNQPLQLAMAACMEKEASKSQCIDDAEIFMKRPAELFPDDTNPPKRQATEAMNLTAAQKPPLAPAPTPAKSMIGVKKPGLAAPPGAPVKGEAKTPATEPVKGEAKTPVTQPVKGEAKTPATKTPRNIAKEPLVGGAGNTSNPGLKPRQPQEPLTSLCNSSAAIAQMIASQSVVEKLLAERELADKVSADMIKHEERVRCVKMDEVRLRIELAAAIGQARAAHHDDVADELKRALQNLA
jgi:hypothetical protein